jgi:uncharacterized protein YbaP (TraB family)
MSLRHRATLFLALCAALAATPTAAASYLWEVLSINNRVYLYGTVHAGRKEWFPLPREVEDAYEESRVLVVEADITDASAMASSIRLMTYPPPDALRAHVSVDDYERFMKLLPRYGLPEPQVSHMKPFMAASLLVFGEWARVGYLPQFSIDAYLIRKAKAEMKPIVELEGSATQIALMASLGEKEAITMFKGTLDALESGLTSEQIASLVGAWQKGDPKLVLDIARRYNERVPGAAAIEEKFVWSRHEAMAAKIEGFLNGSRERHFVAVGALHLAGPRGLLEILRKRGYLVRQREAD